MKPLENVLLLFLAYYLTTAPFTKVEESFNIQAIHDLIYNDGTDDFDHLQFPGVVPRTFTGAWFVASLCKIVRYFAPETTKFTMQVLARSIIGLFNFSSLVTFKRAIVKLYGRKRGSQIGNWFLVLLLGQFHMLFYLSRPLPNMFAMPLVLTAYSWVLESYYAEGLRLLAFASIVFRAELLIMCGTLAASLKYHRKLSVLQIVFAGASGLALGGICSLLIDSKYWREFPMVPEINGFIFNVVEGKSSDWGTEPYMAYFNKYLLNALGNPLLFPMALFAGLVTPRNLLVLTQAIVGYVIIYSFQPHKELRFIIYVVPVLTALAARGIDYLYYTQFRKSLVVKVGYVVMIASTGLAIVASLAKLHISADNYPGGTAIQWFNHNARANTMVHLDVLSCMTGVTRFQYAPGFVYDKTEGGNLAELWSSFDYYIGDINSIVQIPGEWTLVHSVSAFQGIQKQNAIKIIKNKQLVQKLVTVIFSGWATAKQLYKETWYEVVKLEPAIGVYERIAQST